MKRTYSQIGMDERRKITRWSDGCMRYPLQLRLALSSETGSPAAFNPARKRS